MSTIYNIYEIFARNVDELIFCDHSLAMKKGKSSLDSSSFRIVFLRKSLKIIAFAVLILAYTHPVSSGEVLSTTGVIDFALDNSIKMKLSRQGLAIGVEVPSSNLHVNGNVILDGELCIGGRASGSNFYLGGDHELYATNGFE